jgi:hypothetical protein
MRPSARSINCNLSQLKQHEKSFLPVVSYYIWIGNERQRLLPRSTNSMTTKNILPKRKVLNLNVIK